MRVLISAYACEPGKGSEPAVGWNWVRQIARFHEIWVITRANNRPPIEAALSTEPLPNAHWVFFDLPRWASFWKRGEKGIHAYYALWQLGAFFVARKLHRKINFELTHHLTFGQFWSPAFAAFLPVPFIWGPVGGGESAPRNFWWDFSLVGRVFELLRDLVRGLARVNPFVCLAAHRSRVALATTQQTARRLSDLGAHPVVVHPQFGLTAREMELFGRIPSHNGGAFRILSIGRLIHWKGYHLALRAFAAFRAEHPQSEYWLVNSGPEEPRLRKLARRLGVEGSVRFWGRLPKLQDVYDKLAQSDVLIHPALHEAFGNVCLEAMAAGRPVVCFDLGGPALQVTEETGIKVAADSPEQSVRDLAAALARLEGDPNLRAQMGCAGRRRVKENFNWDTKVAFMMEVYKAVGKPAQA